MSLIDVIVCIAIMLLVTGFMMANSRTFRRQAALEDAALILLNGAEDARNRSVSAKQLFATGKFPTYGLYFDTNAANRVTLYADCVDDDNPDGILNASDSFVFNPSSNACTGAPSPNGLVENRPFASTVTISELRIIGGINLPIDQTTSKAYIEFVPPQPSIWISDDQGPPNVLSYGRLQITLRDATSAKTKIINLWTSGRMDIQ